MTRDEILAADEATLKAAINATLKEDWAADQITHADLIDECDRRWGVRVAVLINDDWWDAYARDRDDCIAKAHAPTRRLAELRALALALKERGVLA